MVYLHLSHLDLLQEPGDKQSKQLPYAKAAGRVTPLQSLHSTEHLWHLLVEWQEAEVSPECPGAPVAKEVLQAWQEHGKQNF